MICSKCKIKDVDYLHNKSNKCIECTVKTFSTTKPLPINKLKIWTVRKREALGLPTGIVSTSGGRDYIRELVRMRDKHTCQYPGCGKKWIEGKRRFDIHHLDEKIAGIIPSRKISIKYDRENVDKLITFCHKCHFKWHLERGHRMGLYTKK